MTDSLSVLRSAIARSLMQAVSLGSRSAGPKRWPHCAQSTCRAPPPSRLKEKAPPTLVPRSRVPAGASFGTVTSLMILLLGRGKELYRPIGWLGGDATTRPEGCPRECPKDWQYR